jgi:hypothetical protein
MIWEYTYTVIERREEGWAGNYGRAGADLAAAKAGAAQPGRITGGCVDAESDEQARAAIKVLHGDNCEIVSVVQRTAKIEL